MNGHNLTFRNNPIWYVAQRAINNVSWFMKDQANSINQQRNRILNTAKSGTFDLLGDGQAKEVILAPTGNPLHTDALITAYWCPFIQGNVLPGFVDIPRHNPQHNFVFTAAMNGCALVATTSPFGKNMIRIYHHQHPESVSVNQLIHAQGQILFPALASMTMAVQIKNTRPPMHSTFSSTKKENGSMSCSLKPEHAHP